MTACSDAAPPLPTKGFGSGAALGSTASPEAVSNAHDAEMISIPGATFEMGCTGEDEPRCAQDLHTETVEDFELDRYEVLREDYLVCVADGVCTPPFFAVDPMLSIPEGDDVPVGGIDHTQAEIYCEWADKRLPTSAEWELAARGPDGGNSYPWGDDWDPSLCNGCDTPWTIETEHSDYTECDGSVDGYSGMAPKDAFPEGDSFYGVAQMCGNAFEWTSDPWEATEGSGEDLSGEYWVIRGGGFGPFNGMGDATNGLLAWKEQKDPTNAAGDHIGFRCAR